MMLENTKHMGKTNKNDDFYVMLTIGIWVLVMMWFIGYYVFVAI